MTLHNQERNHSIECDNLPISLDEQDSRMITHTTCIEYKKAMFTMRQGALYTKKHVSASYFENVYSDAQSTAHAQTWNGKYVTYETCNKITNIVHDQRQQTGIEHGYTMRQLHEVRTVMKRNSYKKTRSRNYHTDSGNKTKLQTKITLNRALSKKNLSLSFS